jgi:outer membrane receptor protein involved in Fe transport
LGTHLKAYDVQGDYIWRGERFGELHFFTVATWQPQLQRQTTPGQPAVDSAGFSSGILKWRANAGLDWRQGLWTVGWNAQYYDSYFAYAASATPQTISDTIRNQGAAKIPRQLYHDVFATYRFDVAPRFAGGVFEGTEVTAGIENVFDKSPPILATIGTDGGYSTYADPRMRRFSLVLRKRF